MTRKLSYERYAWFHGRIRAGTFPNAVKLAAEFGISPRQAQRDLEFMQERLHAPLRYDPGRRGFEYENNCYELPPVWLTEEELQALSLSLRLAAAIPDHKIKTALRELVEHILPVRSASVPLDLAKIEEKISIKNIAYYRVPEATFHAVTAALFGETALKISYHTPYADETTERIIRPLHLLCYMGNWHLIAFCGLRREIRDFAVSRILAVEPCAETLPLPPDLPPPKEFIRRNFGVITGDNSTTATLRFSATISPLVAEQQWHEAQQTVLSPDGSLTLSFPVSGLYEITREILKYGADVEVVAPDELREAVKREIVRMGKIYR
ncbi:MAG: YafY family transcriptional regulator [Syntrophobacterales bacterium]|nr:YafY family transcriptional regulator [Syntrophobacterales bacterium]